MKQIQVPVEVGKIETMADKGNKLVMYTPELKPEEQTILFGFAHKQVWMGLGDAEIENLDIPEVLPDIEGGKTDSQRLRAVLYRLWQAQGQPDTFTTYYKSWMERTIDGVKGLLP